MAQKSGKYIENVQTVSDLLFIDYKQWESAAVSTFLWFIGFKVLVLMLVDVAMNRKQNLGYIRYNRHNWILTLMWLCVDNFW